MRRVLLVLFVAVWLLGWSGGTSVAAPLPPDFEDAAAVLLATALPDPPWEVYHLALVDGAATVCLRGASEILSDQDGLLVESLQAAVQQALTPLDWQTLSVQAFDSQLAACRPLSDWLPREVSVPQRAVTDPFSHAVTTLNATEFPRSLAGKTIYVSAGHGWQWSATLSAWRTQRSVYENFIEDHNNAEVVDQYLIPYLENAGATVISVRERDWNVEGDLVDNDGGAPFYTESAGWATGSGIGYAGGTYRFAQTVTEPATMSATWVLSAAQTNNYALYAWVEPGGNRAADAHYVVTHAAGVTDCYLDQRIHEATWRYLGTFPFYSGTLTVTLDNLSANVPAVVVADALRLGGGSFDSLEGIATDAPSAPDKPWWESATYYYSQRMGLDPNDWSYYNDVVARPIFSRWNHAWTGADALYLSWHTNGYNGTARGTESYVHNGDTFARTAGSLDLQRAVHDELVHDIRLGWDAAWTDRGKKQANLGEIRMLWDDEPTTRMPGVLLEIAFHDHPDDALALKSPRFAQLTARAVYQGIVQYFETRDGIDLLAVPEPPTHLRVQNVAAGALKVAWSPSATDSEGLLGDAPDAYRVYTSPDGFAWGAPFLVPSTTTTLTGLLPGQMLYVRVTAVNAGGESFPTQVLGARVGAPHLLLVNGFDKLNASASVVEQDPREGDNLRMWLQQMNSGAYVVHHGTALPALLAWDSASNEAVADGDVRLGAYPLLDWISGEESSDDDGSLNAAERAALEQFVDAGGSLLISGSELAWDLVSVGRDPDFLQRVLKADYVSDDAGTYTVSAVAGGVFAGLPDFSFNAPQEYDVAYPDVIAPRAGAAAALNYVGGSGGVAVLQYSEQCQRLLYFGFPLETVSPDARVPVMAAAWDYLGACALLDTQIVEPFAGGYYSSTPNVLGTAQGLDLARVEVQLQRESDAEFWDGTLWGELAWVTASGTLDWAYGLPALADDGYTLRARAMSLYTDTSPAEVYFVYDVTPPLTPTLITPTGSVVLTTTEVVFEWLPPLDYGSPLGYDLRLDGGLHLGVTSAYTTTLTEGAHSWQVRAIDAAGNLGPWSSEAAFEVETALATLVFSPPAGGYYSSTPVFSGTASGTALEGVEVQVEREDALFWSGSEWVSPMIWLTATGSFSWAYQLPVLQQEGLYTLRARAVGDGAQSDIEIVPFIFDVTPPFTPTLITPTAGVELAFSAVFFRWESVSDAGAPLVDYQLEVDAVDYVTSALSYTLSLPSAMHSWRVRSRDAADNFSPWSNAASFRVTLNQLYLPLVIREFTSVCAPVWGDGFEESVDTWHYNKLALRVSDRSHNGLWSARVGIPLGELGTGSATYSSVAHDLELPGAVAQIKLLYWVYPIAAGNDPDDLHYVSLREQDGTIHTLSALTSDTRAWELRSLDLSAYAGQEVLLYFGSLNDGDALNAALYIDDVELVACK